MHHVRHPPAALLHAALAFDESSRPSPDAPAPSDPPHATPVAPGTELSSSSDDDDDEVSQKNRTNADSALDALPIPLKGFTLGGHAPFLDIPPSDPEPLGVHPIGMTYQDVVVHCIVNEAERLVANTASSSSFSFSAPSYSCSSAAPSSVPSLSRPSSFASYSAAASASASDSPSDSTGGLFPRMVYDSFPTDGASPHAGALPDSLRFDADFESANLRRAIQTGPTCYGTYMYVSIYLSIDASS